MVDDAVKMACAPGAVWPYCSSTTGVMRFSMGLEAEAVLLAICLALSLFFSEKFLGDIEMRAHGVDFHVQPQILVAQ